LEHDSILEQNRINQNLIYEKKILEDEKKIIQLSEKASKSRNWMFFLMGAIAVIITLFMAILLINMRKNQAKLKIKNDQIKLEKDRSDELLLNILPEDMARELKVNGFAKAQSFDNVTVFFSDFKDFTKISEQLTPAQLVEEIDICFKAFDNIIEKYDIEKIKTVGDAYICVAGLDKTKEHNPNEIIMAAIEIRNFVDDRIVQMTEANKVSFEIRIGVHTGPIVAGIVGFKKFAYDIWGDTVNTAARMEQYSLPGKINVSAFTFELIKEHFTFTYRGKIEAKNKGEIDMYFIHESIQIEAEVETESVEV
jgi:class 3 adenylate cyclase